MPLHPCPRACISLSPTAASLLAGHPCFCSQQHQIGPPLSTISVLFRAAARARIVTRGTLNYDPPAARSQNFPRFLRQLARGETLLEICDPSIYHSVLRYRMIGVTAHQNAAQPRSLFTKNLRQSHAIHARHDHITDQQVDCVFKSRSEPKRFFPVGTCVHGVPAPAECGARRYSAEAFSCSVLP
jgi:hypothetical protein